MNKRIEINELLTKIIETDEKPEVIIPTHNFTRKYFGSDALTDLTLMASCVRYISADNKALIIERPPTIKSINVAYKDATKEYKVPLPWRLYSVKLTGRLRGRITEMKYAVRPTTINMESDSLYTCDLEITKHLCEPSNLKHQLSTLDNMYSWIITACDANITRTRTYKSTKQFPTPKSLDEHFKEIENRSLVNNLFIERETHEYHNFTKLSQDLETEYNQLKFNNAYEYLEQLIWQVREQIAEEEEFLENQEKENQEEDDENEEPGPEPATPLWAQPEGVPQ